MGRIITNESAAMKSRAFRLALIAGLIVAGAALHESRNTQAEACAAAIRQSDRALLAPDQSRENLGFLTMDQFNRQYPYRCAEPNTEADLFSCAVAGLFVGLVVYCIAIGASAFKRKRPGPHPTDHMR